MIKSKKIKILIISILCILTITIGLSYGYYLLNKVQENNNIAGSKCFNLEFTNEKNAISLDNMYPISDEEGRKLTPYSFTITNTCDMLAGYTVNMEMLEGTTLNSKYLDVMVNNEQIKLLTNYESTSTVITGSTESRILAKGTLAYNDSVDYTVRFWMDKDVEDTESMNKLFKSKIVISATPSSWNPKDAGYDTLHDAILANEYQTTPADAISKIEAKRTPDLSKSAPAIKWVEKVIGNGAISVTKPAESVIITYNKDTGTGDRTTQASALTLNDSLLKLYLTKSFDSETAKYSLENSIYIDPTNIDFNSGVKYYFVSESIYYNQIDKKLATSSDDNNNVIYQITGATRITGSTIWNDVDYESATYKLDVIVLGGLELATDGSDKGIYQTTDDYGTTYYYRGNVKNNNVYFANNYWLITRINGDGSIRLLYNGTVKNASGADQSINNKTSQFNNLYNDPAYVGYMYGNPDSTTFNEVHANTNDSTVKDENDTWYKVNIVDNGYNVYVSDTTGFCGDRILYSGNGVDNNEYSYFGAFGRHFSQIPKFICQNSAMDLYTLTDSNIGNKSLTYPVGLITYDELVYAGMDNRHFNKLSYAYSSQNYWTMSPSIFFATNETAFEWFESSDGTINPWKNVNALIGIRPVINLKSDVKITGGIGTSNDPYVIDTSK